VTLIITPDMLAGMYEYLRTTPPFKSWRLPPSSEVKFKISKSNSEYGRYQWDGKRHTITGSKNAIGQTYTLARFVAHEMIHLHLEITGKESRNGGVNTHNTAFKRYAVRVCKYHGFDLKAFY
jgi:hypothetical protein